MIDATFEQKQTPSSLGPRPTVGMAWSAIDVIEPLLLLVAGAAVFQLERFPPQRLLFVLALLLVPYLLRWIFYGAPSAGTLADLPLALLFLVLVPMTLWVTPYFWEFTWPELLRMLWGGAVLLGVINWALPRAGRVLPHSETIRSGRVPLRLALLTAAYLLLGVALALLGLFNMALVNKIPLVNTLAATLLQIDLSRLPVDDTFNPNRVAALLILVAPLPLAWLLAWHPAPPDPARQQRDAFTNLLRDLSTLLGTLAAKVGWLLLWLLFTGGLLLTQSRSALVAVAIASLLILLLTGRQPEGGLRLLGGLLVFGLLVAMGYFILRIEYSYLLALTADSFDRTTTAMLDTRTLSERMVIWERALHGIADHPLTGYGLGTFAEIAQQSYPLPGYVPGEINHAHNLFLQTALDLGVPGLITFATLVVLAGLGLGQSYRTAPPQSPQATWALGLLGCFTGFLVYNLFDGLTLGARPAVAMWFFLGLAIAAGQRQALIEALGGRAK